MIGRLRGRLAAKQPPLLLIDVGGVGYEVEAPMSTVFKLPALDAEITLHTHLVVREDAQMLFGFATLAERGLFRELIRISGIGPKVALAILSGIGADDFWQAVNAGDAGRLVKLPGVGKKTAERLIVEMRDRAGAAATAGELGFGAAPAAGFAASPLSEARAALLALGYKPPEAQRMTERVYKEQMTVEQIVQEALRRALR